MKSKIKERLILLAIIGSLTLANSCNKKEEPIKIGDESLIVRNQKIDKILENANFSGTALIYRKGEILYQNSFGFSDKEAGIRNTPFTIYDMGSVTKPFTAMAIMKLAEESKISVQDKLPKYFNNVPEDKKSITIEHLLTHGSGLPTYPGSDYEPVTQKQFIDNAFALDLLFEPGKGYEYSNTGMSLLGIIIEKVSGLSYEQYLKKAIFEPAGMTQTGYKLPEWDLTKIAVGYIGLPEAIDNFDENFKKEKDLKIGARLGKPNELPWDLDGPYWSLKANGGLLTTAQDMLKLHKALQAYKILSRESTEIMYKKYVAEEPGGESFRGYGWNMLDTDLGRLATHNGSNLVFYADYLRFVDDDSMLFIVTNEWKNPDDPLLAMKILEALFN